MIPSNTLMDETIPLAESPDRVEPDASVWADAWLPLATGAVAAAVLFVGRTPFSNIDDSSIRAFGSAYWGSLRGAIQSDLAAGRFRPVYWALEGALGWLTGSSATGLMAGRLLALIAATAVMTLLMRRLGARPAVASLLALAASWSLPALEVWCRGGPAEAFGQPLALASVLVALAGRGGRGVAGAAALGLVACLAKESYAPWTAAALLARGIWGRTRSEPWTVSVLAAVGIGAQFVPAVVAWLAVRGDASYSRLVVSSLSVPTRELALRTLQTMPFAVAAAAVGGVVTAFSAARSGLRRWALEDAVVLVAAAAVAAGTWLVGVPIDRYLLPLTGALLLVAARGTAVLERSVPRRLLLVIVLVVTVPTVAAAGARGWFRARLSDVDRRVDERFRVQIADAFRDRGEVLIVWVPADIERVLGALIHLKEDGVDGRAQVVACVGAPEGQEGLYRLFEPYRVPVTGSATMLLSTFCPMVEVGQGLDGCMLVLPGVRGLEFGLWCSSIPDRAAVVRRP